MEIQQPHPVILFDGECNLCSGAVQFVIKRDPTAIFRFASLQSEFGQKVARQFNMNEEEMKTFILLKDRKIFTKSTGALMVAKRLSGLWPILYGFIIIPPFIRNAVYNFISANRYKWFGKKNECWVPTPKLKERFL